ncbi:hypothetical protein ACQPXH_11065 [Nocardia sp. CA-135953]|uniref:hypothetical protein n=1 Tax=Nocardia sp. CA-135953 TaxID=3239978 RepID=UPI003D95BBFB
MDIPSRDTRMRRPGAGETLGLDPGSVQTACTGSGVIGSATILLGLATGSGISGSGLIGTGSVGSSGSGLGSVVVGSAMTGSALLTCLLLLPALEPPGIPLQLGPPPPAPAIPVPAAPIAPREFPPATPALAIAPETPIRTTRTGRGGRIRHGGSDRLEPAGAGDGHGGRRPDRGPQDCCRSQQASRMTPAGGVLIC